MSCPVPHQTAVAGQQGMQIHDIYPAWTLSAAWGGNLNHSSLLCSWLPSPAFSVLSLRYEQTHSWGAKCHQAPSRGEQSLQTRSWGTVLCYLNCLVFSFPLKSPTSINCPGSQARVEKYPQYIKLFVNLSSIGTLNLLEETLQDGERPTEAHF